MDILYKAEHLACPYYDKGGKMALDLLRWQNGNRRKEKIVSCQ